MEKDLVKLRAELYDKVVEMYGDEYKWIKVDITMFKEKPKFEDGLSFSMDTGMIEKSRDWMEIQGPNENNSGAMWDKSNAEKINS
jgi:hypothetical protein